MLYSVCVVAVALYSVCLVAVASCSVCVVVVALRSVCFVMKTYVLISIKRGYHVKRSGCL